MLKKLKLLLVALLASFLFASDDIDKIETMVLNSNSGKYDITGYFAYYRFGSDEKSNWTFTFAKTKRTFQLLGDTSEENIQKMGVFGWVKQDVTPNESMYYMVQYESTPFGWILFSVDESNSCKNIYKLTGQDAVSKSFSYDIDKDGKTDVLSDLKCKVNGDSVEFYSPTLQVNESDFDDLLPPSLPIFN